MPVTPPVYEKAGQVVCLEFPVCMFRVPYKLFNTELLGHLM